MTDLDLRLRRALNGFLRFPFPSCFLTGLQSLGANQERTEVCRATQTLLGIQERGSFQQGTVLRTSEDRDQDNRVDGMTTGPFRDMQETAGQVLGELAGRMVVMRVIAIGFHAVAPEARGDESRSHGDVQ
jgi:hypothetical protein